MDWIPALLFVIVSGIVVLILAALFAEPVAFHLRRYLPNLEFDGETPLLWGLLLSAILVSGLVVVYLLSKP